MGCGKLGRSPATQLISNGPYREDPVRKSDYLIIGYLSYFTLIGDTYNYDIASLGRTPSSTAAKQLKSPTCEPSFDFNGRSLPTYSY